MSIRLTKDAFEPVADGKSYLFTNDRITIRGSDGIVKNCYDTIDAAVAALVANDILVIKSGEYTLTGVCNITKSGVVIVGEGSVTINGAVGADCCFKTVFGTASGTKSVTFKNLNINHTDDATQVGIQLDNVGATAKVNCYLIDMEFYSSSATTANAIDVDHTVVAGQAIRVYANRCTFKGPINIVVGDNGDRFRFTDCELRAGLVSDSGNYDAEILLNRCMYLDGAITGGHSNQRAILVNCVTETNADPNVYGLAEAADVATQAEQVIGS
jgi:hypothetical protein